MTAFELQLYRTMRKAPKRWDTVLGWAQRAGLERRTTSRHLGHFRVRGIVEELDVAPAPQYRLVNAAQRKHNAYACELDKIVAALGDRIEQGEEQDATSAG